MRKTNITLTFGVVILLHLPLIFSCTVDIAVIVMMVVMFCQCPVPVTFTRLLLQEEIGPQLPHGLRHVSAQWCCILQLQSVVTQGLLLEDTGVVKWLPNTIC